MTVTSNALSGTVDGIDFTYQLRLTALGGPAGSYLTNSGNFVTFNDKTNTNLEFKDTRGLRVEFINITESDSNFDV